MSEPNQYQSLCESLYLALADDPFYQQLQHKIVGGGIDGYQGMLRYYEYSIIKALAAGTATFPPTDEQWGIALWAMPDPSTDNINHQLGMDTEAFFNMHMGPLTYSHYIRVCESMAQLSKPHISPDDWYLSIVGIHPDFQSRGLGKTLLQPVLQKADQEGVATYLETFIPRNIRFYESLGYELLASLDEPVLGAEYQLLRRLPAS